MATSKKIIKRSNKMHINPNVQQLLTEKLSIASQHANRNLLFNFVVAHFNNPNNKIYIQNLSDFSVYDSTTIIQKPTKLTQSHVVDGEQLPDQIHYVVDDESEQRIDIVTDSQDHIRELIALSNIIEE